MLEFLGLGKNKENKEEPQAEEMQEDILQQQDALEEIRLNEQELQLEAEAQYESQESYLAEMSRHGGKKKEEKQKKSGKKPHPFAGNTFVICFAVAFLINLFTETVARQSQPGTGGLMFLVESPLVFLANTLIIFATLSIAALFKRRAFVMTIVSSVWLAIAIGNGVILTQRMTPLNMKDLTAFADAITLFSTYFDVVQTILLVGGILIAVAVLAFLFIKGPRREKVNYIGSLFGIAASWGVMLAVVAGLIHIGVLSTFFGSLPYAYRDYGVPYCFTNTWLNTGIHKPAGYNASMIKSLIPEEYLTDKGTYELEEKDIVSDDDDMPNILFLQLESFVDPLKFKHVAFSEDPIPYYRSLMKKYSTGSLTVPACGAGTANTECEFMTGLSMHFFGPGEYPFKSVLSKKPAESIARDLSSIGYDTHAIHNHRALFYTRNEVFANMGYDTFTSVEYMSDIQKTPKGWAKDKILTSQIMDALKYSDKKDYIYTISVQGHGQYPSEKLLADPDITVVKAPNEATENRYEYYANEVHEMDVFIKDLTEKLSQYDEKVILVMYGDHIPALDIAEENYDAKDLFQTQYVIWSNYETEKKDKDIKAYEMPAEILDRLGIHVGVTTIYHQTHDHSKRGFLSGLKALGHDMLYGKCYIYGGKNPFKKSDMKLGVKDIKIDKVVEVGGKYYIQGKNFTEESKITLDGTPLETVYLSSNLLGLLQDVDPNDASKMKVSQIDRNTSTIISTTE